MAIIKYPYELSIWDEKLTGIGQKTEEKVMIIGANDMTYEGKATGIKLVRKINGTNQLTFQMVDRFFDSKIGDFVINPFIDELYAERKLKLHYKNKWYEFYVKNVKDDKRHESSIKTYTCTDSYIDELARNGYGITFDEELYNNVEEIGTFTEEILEDSIWYYNPQYNWGDFTEYTEEKLFKIPTSQFNQIEYYKINFACEESPTQKQIDEGIDNDNIIVNINTNKKRPMNMSDDLARVNGCYWDSYDEKNQLKSQPGVLDINKYKYIYIPYSCLNFCYINIERLQQDIPSELPTPIRSATEAAAQGDKSYYLTPNSINPNTLIQFLAFTDDDKLEIDEAGLIINTNYHYFMTLDQWNKNILSNLMYIFEDKRYVPTKFEIDEDIDLSINYNFKYLTRIVDNTQDMINYACSLGTKVIQYDNYLSDLNNFEQIKGKKISITNRTEMNISNEIDSFVKVYNNKSSDFNNYYSNESWTGPVSGYRICSQTATRQIIPELARNYIQNGTNIQSTDGWDTAVSNSIVDLQKMKPQIRYWKTTTTISNSNGEISVPQQLGSYLYFNSSPLTADLTLTIQIVYTKNSVSKQNIFNNIVKDSHDFDGYINEKKWGSKIDSFRYVVEAFDSQDEQPLFFYKIEYEEDIHGYYIPTEIITTLEQASNYIKDIHEKVSQLRELYSYTSQQDLIDDNVNIAAKITNILENYDLKFDFTWGTRKEHTTKRVDTDELQGALKIVNFGAVAQEKKIEKDKIYCLGLDICIRDSISKDDDFYIEIGEGFLDGNNNYQTFDDKTIRFLADQLKWGGDLKGFQERNRPSFWSDIKNNAEFNVYGVYEPWGQTELKEMKTVETYVLFKTKFTINNPYIVIRSTSDYLLKGLYLFEAFTKGKDQFENAQYRYSGRNLLGNEQPLGINADWNENSKYSYSHSWTPAQIKPKIIFDTDLMPGDSYSYEKYFIQQLTTNDNKKIKDTFRCQSYLSNPNYKQTFLLDSKKYADNDYKINTNYIDLSKCPNYKPNVDFNKSDCAIGHICYYQKFGYCPYLFETEKHCRKIRTLKGEKSNRFNLIQELSKVFKCYPVFNITYKNDDSGKINTIIRNGIEQMDKSIYFITEKGVDRPIGFRYKKNLSNVSRSIVSDKIVSKLYVSDVDSEFSKTGLCSIKTAEDNPSKDSYIIDFSYYIAKNILSQEQVNRDLYGISSNQESEINIGGFLKRIGYYNQLYDSLSNKIINLQNSSYNDLESHITINLEGINEAKTKLREYQTEISKYYNQNMTESSIYKTYVVKYCEQEAILSQLIIDTFFTEKIEENNFILTAMQKPPDTEGKTIDSLKYKIDTGANNSDIAAKSALEWLNQFEKRDIIYKDLFNYWFKNYKYDCGMLGQYCKEANQIIEWKKQRAKYLEEIKKISNEFFKMYEPFLKEGTWSDSNYIDDNAYYHGALDVAAQGAIPKIEYNFNVMDLQAILQDDDYFIDLADSTFVEDTSILGYNNQTGLPNHLKVLVSEIDEELDNPGKNSIKIQNFTTQFDDLFQQVTASVQSLAFNENIYRRAKNFTSLQNIKEESLQGTLNNNDLTFVDKNQQNIVIDSSGQSGSDINNRASKYKLTGQGLFFSNDGGITWKSAITPGKGLSEDYISTENIETNLITFSNAQGAAAGRVDEDGLTVYKDGSNNINYGPNGITTSNNAFSIQNQNNVMNFSALLGTLLLQNSAKQDLFKIDSNGNVNIGGNLALNGNMRFNSPTSFNIGNYTIAIGGTSLSQLGTYNVVDDIANIGGGIYALRLFSISKGNNNIFSVLASGIYKGGTIIEYPNTNYWNISGGTLL